MKYTLIALLILNGVFAFAEDRDEQAFEGKSYSYSYGDAWKTARKNLFSKVNNQCHFWEQAGEISYSFDKERQDYAFCTKENTHGKCISWGFSERDIYITTAKASFYCELRILEG